MLIRPTQSLAVPFTSQIAEQATLACIPRAGVGRLPTAASPPATSVSGGEAPGEARFRFGCTRDLLGSCLGQKDPQ